MPGPYRPARKRVIIQSSAAHGRFVGEGLDPPGALMVPQASSERSRPLPAMLSVGAGHARPGTFPANERPRIAAGGACPAPTSPLKLKLHLFRQVCRGRIYASRAVYPLYRIIGTAAAGGIYAAPTSQPIIFILVYGCGRGMPRPYKATRKQVVIQSSAAPPFLHNLFKTAQFKLVITIYFSQTCLGSLTSVLTSGVSGGKLPS